MLFTKEVKEVKVLKPIYLVDEIVFYTLKDAQKQVEKYEELRGSKIEEIKAGTIGTAYIYDLDIPDDYSGGPTEGRTAEDEELETLAIDDGEGYASIKIEFPNNQGLLITYKWHYDYLIKRGILEEIQSNGKD